MCNDRIQSSVATPREAAHPRLAIALIAALLAAVLFTAGPAAAQANSAATLASMKALVQEIQVVLDRALIGADHVMATKIEALSAEATRALRQIEKAEDDLMRDANAAIDDPVRAVHQLMADARHLARSSERRVFLDLNQLLVQFSGQLDALPLVDVTPYVAALEPARILPAQADRRISIYGFFGSRSEERLPRVRLAGVEYELQRQPNGVFFDLPHFPRALAEESYLDLEILVPVRRGLFRRKAWQSVHDRIYIQRATPFDCQVVAFEPNPDRDATVDAQVEFTDYAATQGGQGRPSNQRTVSAEDLLIQTVPDAVTLYETGTARIQALNERFWGNAACSDHSNWSGQIVRWNPDLVEFSLSAPSIGPHNHSGMRQECLLGICTDLPYYYLHGGGGSHADIGLRPRFVVRRKGVPANLPQPPRQLRLARAANASLDLPMSTGEWSVHVSCDYKDGDERYSVGPLVLTSMDVEEGSSDVVARWDQGRLTVGTIAR